MGETRKPTEQHRTRKKEKDGEIQIEKARQIGKGGNRKKKKNFGEQI